MFKDDRMISVLTFLVFMVAVGTMAQRIDVLDRLFGAGGAAVVLNRDEMIVRANVLSSIDVLANDTGLEPEDAEDLIIVSQPKCGQVYIEAGKLQYLPAARCVGTHSFTYRLVGHGEDLIGEVIASVRNSDPKLAAADAQRDQAAAPPLQPGAGTTGTVALAKTAPAPPHPQAGGSPSPLPATAPAAAGRPETPPLGQVPPQIGAVGTGAAGRADPGDVRSKDVLAAFRDIQPGSNLAPVDTTPPPPLAADLATGAGAPAGAGTGTGTDTTRSAALPSAIAACTIPPTLIVAVKPAAITEEAIDAPCQADSVVELSYDGLRFGVALDRHGAGSIDAVGLQQASDATVRFEDGDIHEFNIPFAGTEQMDRVVLAWDMPVALELHAFEFGAGGESDGHVRPDHPRSFADVRRHGGGYLLDYEPVGEVGQRVTVYTFWRRHGGPSGVVKLKLDFATRADREQTDACGAGALAEPGFTVLRSSAGILQSPHRRRLAPLDCTAVAAMEDRYIGDAVDDLIVPRR